MAWWGSGQVDRNPDGFFRSNITGAGEKAVFQKLLDEARAALAGYIGASAEDVAFVDNASHGLNAVLRSATAFLKKKKVLCLSIAYGEVLEILRFLEGDFGGAANGTQHERIAQVDVSPIFAPGADLSEDALVELIEPHLTNDIGLASFSHIASIPGIILPVKRLAKLCHDRGILVLIDGAHVPGQLRLNVTDVGADFYVGNGHKWLYTARGCAFLWVAKHAQQYVYPPVIESFPGERSKWAGYWVWQGTTDYTRYITLSIALRWRADLGESAILDWTHDLAVSGGKMLAAAWGTRMLPAAVTAAMANVQLPCKHECPTGFAARLYDKYRFYVPVYTMANRSWARISAAVYNDMTDFELVRDSVLNELDGTES